MKNQYTGDVNDFCKYGLLGALSEHGWRCAQLPNGLPHLGADLAMRSIGPVLADYLLAPELLVRQLKVVLLCNGVLRPIARLLCGQLKCDHRCMRQNVRAQLGKSVTDFTHAVRDATAGATSFW